MTCDFSMGHYRDLLQAAKAGGMKDLGPAAEIISTQFKPIPTKF